MTGNGLNTFSSIPALKAAARTAGNKWFTKGAMEFFNSRIETGILRGAYFISSEQYEDEPRRYTVRHAVRHENGTLEIETVGELGGYETKDAARNAALEAAKRA